MPLGPGQEWMFVGPAADSSPQHSVTDILTNGDRLPNHIWSELSGIYKLWKEGPRSAGIGFNQYRRFINFKSTTDTVEEDITYSQFPQVLHTLTPEDWTQWAGPNLITVPKPGYLFTPVRTQYGDWCPISDYDGAIAEASKRFPELIPAFEQQRHDAVFHSCNMFFCTWEYFDEICQIWFDTLLNFYPHSCKDYSSNPYCERAMGLVAERITDAWIRTLYLRGVEIRTVPRWMLK